MKIVVLSALALALGTTTASAQLYGNSAGNSLSGGGSGLYGTGSNPNNHYVQPHITSNGTAVQGHHQTNPNNTQLDNYSARGNVNPFNGAIGTRTPRW